MSADGLNILVYLQAKSLFYNIHFNCLATFIVALFIPSIHTVWISPAMSPVLSGSWNYLVYLPDLMIDTTINGHKIIT